MARETLDLLLLSDELHSDSLGGSTRSGRYTHLSEMYGRAYRHLGLQPERAATVAETHGLEDYFQESPDGRVVVSLPHRPSLALADLATAARDAGYSVRVVDNFLRWKSRFDLVERICRDTPPMLIGLSTTFIMDPELVEQVVALLRECSPESRIAVGGPTLRRAVALHGCVDFAVFSSGEETMVALLDALSGKRPIAGVPRIAYRDDSGVLVYSPEAADAAQLGKTGVPYQALKGAQIQMPDWSLYPRSPEQVYPIEFSRGCKYNCYYCSYDRGKNVREPEDVAAELLRNAAAGITRYRFSDSNFTDGPHSRLDYAHEICRKLIELDLGLEWSCYARADDMTGELPELMRRAGCFAVFFGIESGDDGILRLMRKGHDATDAENGIRAARAAGILAHANFVVGYPGDTLQSNERTLEFIDRVRPDSVVMTQFWAEEMTPVMGPRMKAFSIVGTGRDWTHATMNSAQAADLVNENVRRLLAAGVTIGNEYELAAFMSFGLTVEEARRHQQDINMLQSDEPGGADERAAAAVRLRAMMLERFPAAVARDVRRMALA